MKPMKALKDNRGVSLVELIVSIAIFGIVAAAAVSMMVFAARTNADVSLDTVQNIKVVSAFDLVKQQLREAQSFDVDVSTKEDNKYKFSSITFADNNANGNNAENVYVWYNDKFVYKAKNDLSSETVLFEGVKNILVISPNISGENPTNTVDYISLLFEFENGDVRQLTVGCRGIVTNTDSKDNNDKNG